MDKKILEVIPNYDDFDEAKYTLKYMKKYGINNVRGGTFCEFKLNNQNLTTIKKMLKGSTNKCYICGINGHYVSECYANEIITGENIKDLSEEEIEVFECSYCDKKFNTLKTVSNHKKLYYKYNKDIIKQKK